MILAIDTAGPNCAVAIASANPFRVAVRHEARVERGHAERLMPMIEAALSEAALRFADLTLIAVTIGPGSFTGVRVGVAVARGLALALDIRACGVGVLDALLWPLRGEAAGKAVAAALDAKRGEAYAAISGTDGLILPPCVADYEVIADRIAALGRPIVLTGSAAPALQDRLAARGIAAEVAGAADHADVEAVAALAAIGRCSTPPRPLYLRAPDAKPQAGKAVARA
ncbi:tRNA (adenosine(37)-N6)-threonylcarbamoyltransferase complex dimerization subunit type 1 TsaB [Faunimonas sp. B44]|uniref:tRNA (adenosine(37)-N6)-threonylcarbamoyltransferase complex dimerization subunit type 1 TsaB n=1 Tax=Faunimonas sp. B44 TaxID=3461493 RepID=UPI004044BC0A